MESESVSAKSVNQRIGVSGIATAFRIISRFCLNRIWLEELNQLCPRITGMTLEESLESRGQSIDSFVQPCPSSEHLGVPVVQRNPSWCLGLSLCFLDIWTLNPCFILTVSRGYILVPYGQVDFLNIFLLFIFALAVEEWLSAAQCGQMFALGFAIVWEGRENKFNIILKLVILSLK